MENSKGGAFLGFFVVPVAVFMLFWNEGRAVKRYKDLKEGAGSVISVASDKVDAANDNKLVHLSGETKTGTAIVDTNFGISETAIKLIRSSEMFQWVESVESSRTDSGKTREEKKVSYQKEWRSDLVDSANFVHKEGRQNPTSKKFNSTTILAKEVKVGAFILPGFLISKINNSENFPITTLEGASPAVKTEGKLYGAGIYFGADPNAPAIGDTKVTFSIVRNGNISAIAQQTGATFAKFPTKTGGTLAELEIGVHEAIAMFQMATERNKILTWMLRGLGFVMLTIGFSLLLGPLAALSSIVPLLGGIVGAGTKFIGFLLAAIVWTITVGVSWIYYRPLIGIVLLVCAVVCLVFLVKKLAQNKKASTAGGPDTNPPPFNP